MSELKRAKTFSIFLALGVVIAGAASAAQSCANWMDQGNGTSWTTCVGDDGTQRCYLISNTPGSTAYEVSCSQ